MTTDEGIRRDLGAVVTSLIDAAGAPGAAVALVADGRLALTAGIGHRDLGRAQPLDADARFYAYSVPKPILATAILRLSEGGWLNLDDPIRGILPEIPVEDAVTVRRLLNHTAGPPDYGAMPEDDADLRAAPGEPSTSEVFLARTLPCGPLFPPGQGWAYSNIGFLLLRRAIERLTRRSLRDALAETVLQPLSLRRTVVAESLADARDLTPGFSTALDRDGAVHDISRRYHPGWVSHGVAISTAAELAEIFEALFAGRLVGPASLAAMRDAVDVPGEHPLVARPAYGLGLMVGRGSPHGSVAGHAGGGPGYSTAVFHFPDVVGRRVTSVALANRDAADLGTEIAFALVAAYADRLGVASSG